MCKERERERAFDFAQPNTLARSRRDRLVKIAPHEAYRRLTGLVLLWVKSSPLLGRSRRPPLADLSPPLGQSCRQSTFFL